MAFRLFGVVSLLFFLQACGSLVEDEQAPLPSDELEGQWQGACESLSDQSLSYRTYLRFVGDGGSGSFAKLFVLMTGTDCEATSLEADETKVLCRIQVTGEYQSGSLVSQEGIPENTQEVDLDFQNISLVGEPRPVSYTHLTLPTSG